jgi:filamentous hemagglutinin family protein
MKTLSGLQGCWKLCVVRFLVLGGRITLTVCFAIAASKNYAWGQVVKDNTLGSESSLVTSPVPGTFQINGGATRGINLFHSFSQFSIPTLGIAYFNNALNIQNIMTRVTGGSVSNIDGLIRANGTANLFLINPNGIIFGPNASLNIGGSFIGSTASSLNFADGTQFSATSTQTTPLLTISVPLGLQFGGNPGSIQVQGDGQGLRTTSNLIDTTAGLRVQPNQTLALVGGDVAISGGTLKTAGGRIELGSVSEPGLVSLTPIDKGWALGYSGIPTFGNIQLSQQTAVDASGAGGGDIQVQGRRVTLRDGSQIEASTLRSKPGGTLAVRASDSIELIGTADGTLSSGFVAQVYRGATGAGGNLILETGRLSVQDGAWITTDTLGSGSGGNLSIETGQLNVRGGAQISASTLGEGFGGSLAVKASDSVQVIGTDAASNPSALFTFTQGAGAAGNLTIETRQLTIQDGAQVVSGTAGKGSGGDLTVNASDSVQVIGIAPDRLAPTILSSSTIDEGAAGNLIIKTGQLIIRDGAQVSTGSSFGSTFDDAIPVITIGTGRGGNLTVKASDSVQVIGTGQLFVTPDGRFTSDLSTLPSGLFTQTQGVGAAGNLTIETGQLIIQDGAQVSASTNGKGAGGTLAVTALDSVQLLGTAPKEEFPSGLFTETRDTGAAGDLTITTGRLIAQNGGQVSASTTSKGSGGKLVVNASNLVVLIGTSATGLWHSTLLAITQGAGDAGDLRIATDQLNVRDRAEVSVSSEGSGKAGNLQVQASSIGLNNQAALSATTKSGDGGNITLQVKDILLMRHGSEISTTAGTAQAGGDGGNITIDADFIVTVPKENSDITANAFTGRGGNINITTQGIYGLQFRPRLTPLSDLTASSEFGVQGIVQINTPDVDPTRGLAELPVKPVNVEVTQGCQAGGKQASIAFFNTGRGGLAPNPYEPISSSDIWEDVPPLAQRTASSVSADSASASLATPPNKIVEAQGWLIDEKGQVVLVAQMPTTHFQGRCRLR